MNTKNTYGFLLAQERNYSFTNQSLKYELNKSAYGHAWYKYEESFIMLQTICLLCISTFVYFKE